MCMRYFFLLIANELTAVTQKHKNLRRRALVLQKQVYIFIYILCFGARLPIIFLNHLQCFSVRTLARLRYTKAVTVNSANDCEFFILFTSSTNNTVVGCSSCLIGTMILVYFFFTLDL